MFEFGREWFKLLFLVGHFLRFIWKDLLPGTRACMSCSGLQKKAPKQA